MAKRKETANIFKKAIGAQHGPAIHNILLSRNNDAQAQAHHPSL